MKRWMILGVLITLFTVGYSQKMVLNKIISPDCDGVDDYLRMDKKNVVDFKIMIFNEAGDLVYTSDDLYYMWAGQQNNSAEFCDAGFYYYQVNYTKRAGKKNRKNGLVFKLKDKGKVTLLGKGRDCFNQAAPKPVAENSAVSNQLFTLQGIIKDATTGAPLPHASIKLENTPKTIVADANGKFTTEIKEGTYKTVVSNKGYASKKYVVEVSKNTSYEFTLTSKGNNTPTETVSNNVRPAVSDVNINIPRSNTTHPYRFALIIGNEDYSSFQRDLGSESNVDFAETDATIFKQYATKTLGIPEENIIFKTNATAVEMDRALTQINLLAKNTGGKAELFFYYAGHGFPDEESKEAHLIPVDVSGSNLKFAPKLTDVYAQLTEHPSKRVTVFLDACFSGGARNGGLIAARGVKVKPKANALGGNLVVFSASTGEQSALPYKEKQHGLFTYYLLKQLQASKGDVSYKTLANYLSEQVGIRSVLVNTKEQNPQVNASSNVQGQWENWNLK